MTDYSDVYEPKAYSAREFAMSDFDADGHRFPDREGTFTGSLECKRWGKKGSMIAYFDLEDYGKIITSAWQNTNYMGLGEIFMGDEVTVTFEKAKNGKIYLRKVE